LESSQAEYEQFIAWAEEPGWLAQRPALLWAARLLTLATLLLFATTLFGLPTTPALVAVLVVNLAFSFTFGGKVDEQITQVAARQGVFAAYGGMFGVLAGQQFTALALQQIQSALTAEGLSADRQMHKLERLMPLADIRRSILFILVQAATLWSLHLLWLLEGIGRQQAGAQVCAAGWLRWATFEALLAALATLHHDHPAWVFTSASTGRWTHPASRASGRPTGWRIRCCRRTCAVGNDVALGPPGSFLLVTGSNMSRQEHAAARHRRQLRAGADGRAGLSAGSLHLPPVTLAASMRAGFAGAGRMAECSGSRPSSTWPTPASRRRGRCSTCSTRSCRVRTPTNGRSQRGASSCSWWPPGASARSPPMTSTWPTNRPWLPPLSWCTSRSLSPTNRPGQR
jgi:hypothetical protein